MYAVDTVRNDERTEKQQQQQHNKNKYQTKGKNSWNMKHAILYGTVYTYTHTHMKREG